MASNKLSLLGVSAFCESMASMLDAGIEISEAASLMKQKNNAGQLNEGLQVIESCLQEGSTLKDAMEKSGMFPDYCLQMVEAGEATGKTEESLLRLSSYYASQHSLKEKITSTIIYPLAMIVLIIIVLFLMLKLVLPAFGNVYETLTGSLSQSSYAYITYAFLFCRIALILMVILVLGVLIAWLMYGHGFKKQISALLSKVPAAGKILRDLALYRFTSAFEVYLSSGFLQDDAILKAREMSDHPEVNKKIDETKSFMDEGNGFGKSANEAELYEPIYGRMLIPAERSGNMEGALKRLSDLLSESVMTSSDALLSSLESVLSGVLMVTVAVALLCVMLPLIGFMNSIG